MGGTHEGLEKMSSATSSFVGYRRRPLRSVAVVGSSGGSSLLMRNPTELLLAINEQLGCIQNGARIVAAQIVCCEEPLDSARPRARAELWIMDAEQAQFERQPQCVLHSELRTVNERARALDAKLADMIIPKVDAVVTLSADARHGGANSAVLKAAGAHKKTVSGTGGTSLSLAAAMYGVELAGNAGGSVATTARTKAIGVAASLAGAWGEAYAPSTSAAAAAPWRSVVNECLPGLVCVACARSLADLLPASHSSETAKLLSSGRLVAPAVGALAATRRSDLGTIATLAGALLGSLCRGSSCCALLAGGFAFPLVAPRALASCARRGVPATSSNIVVGGAVPVILGMLCYAFFGPLVAEVADAARYLVRLAASCRPVAAALGVAINYGSRKHGYYHAYFLPIIALEYEKAEMSALGSLDLLCLCVVGAGACAAQLVVPLLFAPAATTSPVKDHDGTAFVDRRPSKTQQQRQAYPSAAAAAGAKQQKHETPSSTSSSPAVDADASLARRGVTINLLCGDYVEACFPFLERSSTLDYAVYATSFLVGALSAGTRSSAYLPLPLAIVFSNQPLRLAVASLVAFLVPFLAGAASNFRAYRRQRKTPRR